MAKTDVATAKDESKLPAYLQDQSFDREDDGFGLEDVAVPQIKLLQGISPEVEAFDHAKSGHFWHTGLDMSLGDTFRFCIADRRKKYLLSAPLADGQGILARADDAKTWDRTGSWQVKMKGRKEPVTWTIDDLDVDKSGLSKWGTSVPDDSDSPPAATQFYDYLVWLPDHPELGMSVLSLARSKIKSAKKGLNDKIKMHLENGRPMQALIFEGKSTDETGDEGPYKGVKFALGGFQQDESVFNMLREHRGALARLRIKDEAGEDDGYNAEEDDGKGNF